MELLLTLLVLLVFTRIGADVAIRCGQPALVGELIAGVVLGLIVSWLPASAVAAAIDVGIPLRTGRQRPFQEPPLDIARRHTVLLPRLRNGFVCRERYSDNNENRSQCVPAHILFVAHHN